ncbi:MAG: 2,3-bisphosphoglycerate-independent phosphoglycerate mutase [Patescibacteria group bacterium]|jgi:2,3-bisphosphoglycerate-independent phosphoglycerate mutase
MDKLKNVCLVIMDGWGIAPSWGGNAIALADTPNFNTLWRDYPHSKLFASGEAVGLPRDEIGNSEIGHLNIGAGRVVHQDLLMINHEISTGAFYQNPTLLKAFKFAEENNSNVHILGLASPGGVHSHINHLITLLKMSKEQNFDRVFLHLFTDGRDSGPMDAFSNLTELNSSISELGIGKIESLSGRYYAMDRDNHWDRTEKVYDILTSGAGPLCDRAEKAISLSYQNNINDEFIEPIRIGDDNRYEPIKDKDVMIFFNFRRDRIDQITRAFADKNFNGFKRKIVLSNIFISSFTIYEKGELQVESAFHSSGVSKPLAAILSDNKLRQFHIAESEKFPHVTYFLNGGIEAPFSGEDRLKIPSPQVSTYDLAPQMSAYALTEKVIEVIRKESYDFIVVNFANADMVGHTGNIDATIVACKTVDQCIGKIAAVNSELGGLTIITADHGNAEQMINISTGEKYTEHTTNPVPFISVSPLKQHSLELPYGNLANITPTILKYLNIPYDKVITGATLI